MVPSSPELKKHDENLQLNKACDEFEKESKLGGSPRIEDWLQNYPNVPRAALLKDIIELDVEYRRKRGETPAPSDYRNRFPDDGTIVDRVFSAGNGSPVETTPPSSPDTPTSIGSYQVERELGQGNFGKVFLAYDMNLQRQVAIKVPLQKHLDSTQDRREYVNTYLEQGRLLAKLQHPAVVTVHHAEEDPEFGCFIVMEFVEGSGLDKLIKQRSEAWTAREAAEIVACIAEGLHHTFSKGILHRDLKPANVLIDNEGKPRITDFGFSLSLSKLRHHPERQAGTPAYMAPECWTGNVENLKDGKADVWALGVILYELLTLRRPFVWRNYGDLKRQITKDEPKPPLQINKTIPVVYDELCLGCLRKEASERPSAEELAKQLRLLLGSPVKSLRLIPDQSRHFTGRKELLEKVNTSLSRCGRVALSGLGGIGKTEVALEYAYSDKSKYDYVFWVPARSRESIATELIKVAGELGLPIARGASQNNVIESLKRWLKHKKKWLLILDDADPSILKDYLPPDATGHVLVTSRAQTLQEIGIPEPIQVESLIPEESLTFLKNRTDRELANEEAESAKELADELGHLPLALEQAAAYVTSRQATFADYLKSYRKRGLELLNSSRPVNGNCRDIVETTWKLNFEQVKKESPAAADLLHTSAFLAPDNIPLELLTREAACLGANLEKAFKRVDDDPLVVDEVLEPLVRFSLIRRNNLTRSFSVHILVQEVVRDSLLQENQRDVVKRLLQAIAKAHPSNTCVSSWQGWRRLLSHLVKVIDHAKSLQVCNAELVRITFNVAKFLREIKDFPEAEKKYRFSLKVAKKVCEPNSDDTIAILADLVQLLNVMQTRYPVVTLAEDLLRRVREKFSPGHPAIADALLSLAIAHERANDIPQAAKLVNEAVSLALSVTNVKPIWVSAIFSNAARFMADGGKKEAACELLRVGLDLLKKAGARTSIDAALILINLGSNSPAEEQLQYYQDSRMIMEKIDPDHPLLATALQKEASALPRDRKEEAYENYERALVIVERAYGENHPEVAVSLVKLAKHLTEVENVPAAAEEQLKRAIDIRSANISDNDQGVTATEDFLTSVYLRQQKVEEAKRLIEITLKRREMSKDIEDLDNASRSIVNVWYLFEQTDDENCARGFLDRYQKLLKDKSANVASDSASLWFCRAKIDEKRGRWDDVMQAVEAGLTAIQGNSLVDPRLEKGLKDLHDRANRKRSAASNTHRFPQDIEVGTFSHRRPNGIGRNAACFCGSGKKFKYCCLRNQRESHL